MNAERGGLVKCHGYQWGLFNMYYYCIFSIVVKIVAYSFFSKFSQVWHFCSVQKHQFQTKTWKKLSQILSPFCLCILHVSHSAQIKLMWSSGLIPAPSQWNSWFQLDPVLGPSAHSFVHTLAHIVTHFTDLSCLLSLAHCSVKEVMESFDQNIAGPLKYPKL